MTELLTAAQMRAIEQAAIESGRVTGLELMERAGAGVVEAVFEEWPELVEGAHRAVVLCGPGNNGGDGFVVARLLKECGWDVAVFLYGDADKLPPDAQENYARWSALGKTTPLTLEALEAEPVLGPDHATQEGVIIDAIFGTGLTRPVSRELGQCLSLMRSGVPPSWFHYVAVDIRSGICADSGKQLYSLDGGGVHHLTADMTVSFHRAKLGHYLEPAASHSGVLKVVDIGLDDIDVSGVTDALVGALEHLDATLSPESDMNSVTDALRDIDAADNKRRVARAMKVEYPIELVDACDPFVDKSMLPLAHKFEFGHALVLTGGPGRTGAARLAARGALRIGAGLVTLGVPPSAQMEVASQITALMLARVADADGLAEVLEDDRIRAVCLGPGLGFERARELVPVALEADNVPSVVLDADALSAYAEAPEQLFEHLHESCVLTPHAGEFARLFPDLAEKLAAVPTQGPAYSKMDAAREAQERCGAIVVFKGPDTVIAYPRGICALHSVAYGREAPWLATAGAGDVLAGFITGLLGRGMGPSTACEAATWLHVECARAFGPGLIAEDLPEMLPQVLRGLTA